MTEKMMAYRCILERKGFWGSFRVQSRRIKPSFWQAAAVKKRPFVEKRARALLDRDFHVLALGYYLWESPSAQTVRIPVDYMEKAVAFFCSITRLHQFRKSA